MRTTILAELRAEAQEALRTNHANTLLWLDPHREWERLVDQLPSELELLKYDGSQLHLRAAIERRSSGRPRIVYVPLSRQELTVLKECEFILPVWDEDLLYALRRWGVEIDREDEKALLPLLPSLAVRWGDKPLDYWRHLTASGVRARLFDEAQIREFLADPTGAAAGLEREGTLGMFRDFLAEAYGVSDDAASPGRIARLSVSGSFARSERPGEMPSVSRPVARIPLAGPVRCTTAARCRARPRPGDRCGDRTACRGRFRADPLDTPGRRLLG